MELDLNEEYTFQNWRNNRFFYRNATGTKLMFYPHNRAQIENKMTIQDVINQKCGMIEIDGKPITQWTG